MYAVSGVNCAGAPSGAGGRAPGSTSLCAMSRVAAGSGVTVAVTAAVLAAAVLHAGWNALLKGVEDRLATVVLLDLTGLAVAAVALPLVPAPASRGLLAASVVLHVGYELLLLVAYRDGDLSQVYPVARGTAPLLVAAFAGLVLRERLAAVQLAGLAGIC